MRYNFLMWSHIFVYFNFYFTHLVVKHPVGPKLIKNHGIEMGVFTKNQFFNLISTTIKVPLRISNLKNTHFAMIAFLLLLTFILPFIKGQQDLDLTYEVAENLASLPLECHSKLYPFKFNNLWNNASEAKWSNDAPWVNFP